MSDYTLTEKQAQAILDLRLQRLTGLEREKIENEYLEILDYISDLQNILADEQKILDIIKEELLLLKLNSAMLVALKSQMIVLM